MCFTEKQFLMNNLLLKFTTFLLIFFDTSFTFSQVDGNNGNESGEKKKVVILNKAKEVKKPVNKRNMMTNTEKVKDIDINSPIGNNKVDVS